MTIMEWIFHNVWTDIMKQEGSRKQGWDFLIIKKTSFITQFITDVFRTTEH